MAINSVSLLNTNSAVELVKANAIQFANKNNNLNKVTTEKEVNKNFEIKDSVCISPEALEKFNSEKISQSSDINWENLIDDYNDKKDGSFNCN
mgnify:CR=1 FL=1